MGSSLYVSVIIFSLFWISTSTADTQVVAGRDSSAVAANVEDENNIFALPNEEFEAPLADIDTQPRAFESLLKYQNTISYEQILQGLAVLDPKKQLIRFLDLQPGRLIVKSAPGASGRPMVEIPLALESKPRLNLFRPHGLKGLTIVINPGHSGGTLAPLEGKFFRYRKDGEIIVREGNLTWGTALLLKEKLHNAGANVILARDEPPVREPKEAMLQALTSENLSDWVGDGLTNLKNLIGSLSNKTISLNRANRRRNPDKDAFSKFDRWDLVRRADLPEKKSADLTIEIHFNATKKFTDGNGILMLMPGNILASCVDTPKELVYWVRRLLEGETDTMVRLNREVSKSLQHHLRLNAFHFQPSKKAKDRTRNWSAVDIDHGIYAWGELVTLRRTQGPIIYVEGPVTTNIDEYNRLIDTNHWFVLDNHVYPERIKEVAEGIFQGVKNHVSQPPPPQS